MPGNYDLVYIDPPYISQRGVGVDYRSFYHFLAGMTMYADWADFVDYGSKHRRLKVQPNPWSNKHQIYAAFQRLFARFQNSILVVSYRSDGIPTIAELVSLLKRYKSSVQIRSFGEYKYVLSTNKKSTEVLVVGYGN